MTPFTLKTLPLALALSLAVSVMPSAHGANPAQKVVQKAALNAAEVRTTTPLLQNWKFVQDDVLSDAAALAASGAAWQTVSLPHTWNGSDAASTAQTTPASKNYLRGRGWYRLEFDQPTAAATQWLQFDGASIVADVWLNGKKLGQHKGAFTAFRFDVSGKLQAGKNVLLVKTDNSAPTTGSDLTAIAPLSGDFNMSGGLYREVSLITTPHAAHFALDDLGGSGIFAATTAIRGGKAMLSVRAKLNNDARQDGKLSVHLALLDQNGKQVQRAQKPVAIKAGARIETSIDLLVPQPHLWQGVEDPYLYKLVVELRDKAGVTIDKVVQDFGIRQMRFDADKGFFLNGKLTPLHGVSLHQDYENKGWAIGKAEIEESLGLIRELGANTIRLAHYPHSRATLALADKLGFVIWAEIPFVDRSITSDLFTLPGKPPSDCAITSIVPPQFSANLKLQLQELVRQQVNHASIGMWSIANEIGNGGTCLGKDTVTPLLRELNDLAHAEDPSRVTTEADSVEVSAIPGFPSLPTGGITDTWALNRYFMWYYDRSADGLGQALDDMHAKYPKQPVGVSEYGLGSALTHQTDNPLGGLVASFDFSGKTHTLYQPEGYANYGHEQNYAVMAARPYVWGTYVWNMFDFGSGIRHEGDIGGTNTKGLVTFDRKTRKDAFFFYKANWSAAKVTYITGRRYVERAYPVTDVKVYSNADSVKLSVNGAEIGTMTALQCPLKTCVFPNVRLSTGANKLVAVGSYPGEKVDREAADTVTWTLSADNADNVYIAAGQPATGFMSSGGRRYGSDNFFMGGLGFPLTEDGIGAFAGTSKFKTRVANIDDAADKLLWSTVRVAAAGYDIPVANGSYLVTLGFLEPDINAAIGSRVFGVAANGASQIARLDILEAAGAHSTAITRSFKVDVGNGRLKLDFTPIVGETVISNMAILRQ